jgi:hypothetical protein
MIKDCSLCEKVSVWIFFYFESIIIKDIPMTQRKIANGIANNTATRFRRVISFLIFKFAYNIC